MNIAGIRIAPWIGVFGLLFFVVTTTLSQVAPGSEGQVTLSRLSPPVFPPLARVARVNGEVEIALQVRQDGSVESAAVVKGHPLLKAAALDSARQSEFECRECGEGLTAYTLLYTFAYTSTDSCCKPEEISQGTTHAGVTQAENHVTILIDPFCICDPSADVIKVRSPKCLYLWHCSTRYGL